MKRLFFFFFMIIIMLFSTPVNAQAGVNWTLYNNNPVFSGGVSAPMVIMFKDTLRMWYESGSYTGVLNIGYAWSLDGVKWEGKAYNVLSARNGEWDYPHAAVPSVIADGDTLRMWYGGGNIRSKGMRVGYAVSADGINWNRYPDPVMQSNRKDWDKDGVLPGPVIKEGGIFKMWFSGGVDPAAYPTSNSRWSIGLATSPDGVNWTLSDEPVLQHGSSGDYDKDNILAGAVIKTSSGYEMWYSGSHKTGGSSVSMIGYATSTDGVEWKKYVKNPVLSASSPVNNFGDAFYNPHVVVIDNMYQMWFTAWHPGPTIGYATSVLTGIEDDLTRMSKEYKLLQNYPNPFNPSTTIKYSIPEKSFVSLKVYDVLGREISGLVEKVTNSGNYRVTLDAKNLTSGVYFYTLYSKSIEGNKENRITKKMIILK